MQQFFFFLKKKFISSPGGETHAAHEPHMNSSSCNGGCQPCLHAAEGTAAAAMLLCVACLCRWWWCQAASVLGFSCIVHAAAVGQVCRHPSPPPLPDCIASLAAIHPTAVQRERWGTVPAARRRGRWWSTPTSWSTLGRRPLGTSSGELVGTPGFADTY